MWVSMACVMCCDIDALDLRWLLLLKFAEYLYFSKVPEIVLEVAKSIEQKWFLSKGTKTFDFVNDVMEVGSVSYSWAI